jgi:hypothetical protein
LLLVGLVKCKAVPKAHSLPHGYQSYKVVGRAGGCFLVQYPRKGRVLSSVGYPRVGRGLSYIRKPRVGRVLSTVRSYGLGWCCPLSDPVGWAGVVHSQILWVGRVLSTVGSCGLGGCCPPTDVRGWGRGVSSFGT